MKEFLNWLKKRPATKAAWFGAFTGVLALIAVIIQTLILSRQTKLLDRQTNISKAQIEASTRPFVEMKINKNNNGAEYLTIENKGQFDINNFQVYQIHFAEIFDHGWYTSISNGPYYTLPESKKRLEIDLSHRADVYKDCCVPPDLIPKIEREYLNTLVFFQRVIDGKCYLCILPGQLWRLEKGIMVLTASPENTATSSPLGKQLCDVGFEITYEYLKRRPFWKDYELYNSSSHIDLTSTDCLGNIEWKD